MHGTKLIIEQVLSYCARIGGKFRMALTTTHSAQPPEKLKTMWTLQDHWLLI